MYIYVYMCVCVYVWMCMYVLYVCIYMYACITGLNRYVLCKVYKIGPDTCQYRHRHGEEEVRSLVERGDANTVPSLGVMRNEGTSASASALCFHLCLYLYLPLCLRLAEQGRRRESACLHTREAAKGGGEGCLWFKPGLCIGSCSDWYILVVQPGINQFLNSWFHVPNQARISADQKYQLVWTGISFLGL